MRTIAVASVLAVVALAVPARALAAQRYASPTGSGSTCSQPLPCSLVTAVNNASGADQVIVPGDEGTYGTPSSPITTTLHDVPGGVNIQGVAGEPMPVVFSNVVGNALQLNSGGTVTYLHIENLASSGTALFLGSTATSVFARGGGEGCIPTPFATFLNVVCVGGGVGIGGSSSTTGTQDLRFRNVTAIGDTGDGIQIGASGFTQDVFATNVIARGAGNDISTSESSGSVTFTLDHSNYANISPGIGTSITPAGSGTNQTAAPVFANAGMGDFHQAAGSPTIDKGIDDPLNGLVDFEGKPRAFGAHTDIGADEYAPPSVLAESVSAVTGTSAEFDGVVNTQGGGAGFSFAEVDYGLTTTYGSKIGILPAPLPVSAAPQSVSRTATGLAPGTTYHYRLAVTTASGTAYGPDQSFTTPVTTPAPASRHRKCKKKKRHKREVAAKKRGCRKHKKKH